MSTGDRVDNFLISEAQTTAIVPLEKSGHALCKELLTMTQSIIPNESVDQTQTQFSQLSSAEVTISSEPIITAITTTILMEKDIKKPIQTMPYARIKNISSYRLSYTTDSKFYCSTFVEYMNAYK